LKQATDALITLLASTNQVAMWDRYSFSSDGQPTVRYPPSDPLPQTLAFHDTFTGSGSLDLHTPDVAPVGFAWANVSATGMELTGGAARSDNISLNAIYNSDGSSPAVAMNLSFPFYMEIKAQRGVVATGDTDEASFTISTAAETVEVGVAICSNGTLGYFARVVAGAFTATYPLFGDVEHTCRAVFDGTNVIITADDDEKPPQTCPLESFVIGKIILIADSQLNPFPARYEVSEVILGVTA
jgi:hypothetical protein